MLVLNLLVVIGQLNPLGLGSYLIIDGCNWKLRPTHGHTLLRPQSDMETSSGALSTVQLAISINDTSHLLIGISISPGLLTSYVVTDLFIITRLFLFPFMI